MATNRTDDFLFFDPKWYLEQNADVKKSGQDPLHHFITNGWREGRNPSKHFDVQKYINENPELLPIQMNPFLHMAFTHNNSTAPSITFPVECVKTSKVFKSLEKGKSYKRVIVFASFIGDGKISTNLVYLLSKLKKISDAIIFVGDNPIVEEEVKKISNLVCYASFSRHEEYDFGSYKRGLEYICKEIGFENIEELVLCNDSCIGPITPIEDMFAQMQVRDLDFWGITSNPEIFPHLQSYFMVFKNKVFITPTFQDYFKKVKKEVSRTKVILKYELLLTDTLNKIGFKSGSFIEYPPLSLFSDGTFKHLNITTAPLYLLNNKCPLIKLKHLYDRTVNYDGLDETFEKINALNPTLGHILLQFLDERKKNLKNNSIQEKCTTEPEKVVMYQKLHQEISQYKNSKPASDKPIVFRESKIVHKYLDGLNGIEIGGASHNSFGLDKTGGYANVDYKASHGEFWQGEHKSTEPLKVNIVASGDDLPFKDNVLDYVISSHAIEHFFDPIKTIEEWFRVIKTGGYVVMIVPHRKRTFDRNRENTSCEELFARYENKLNPHDYAFRNVLDERGALISDCLTIIKDGITPEGYEPYTINDCFPLHFSVWDTESFVEMCLKMRWKIVEILDVDDKVGNGFLIILQKK